MSPNIDSLLIVFENLNLKSLQFYELTENVCAQNYQQFSAKTELINIVLESDNLWQLSWWGPLILFFSHLYLNVRYQREV